MQSLRLFLLASLVLCGLALSLVSMPIAAQGDRCQVEPVPCFSDDDCIDAGINCACGTGGTCVSFYPYPHNQP